MLTRRSFLRASGITIGTLGTAPSWLVRAAAQGRNSRKILVAIFQRGAADGLNMVVPFADKRYYGLRPTLAVAAPGKENGAIDLDGRFALNRALEPLKEFWDSKQLAIVQAAGSPANSRSHFDAQEYMECGTPGQKTPEGWLARGLPAPRTDTSPMRAVAVSDKLPRTLTGNAGALTVNDGVGFKVGTSETTAILETMYGSATESQLKAQGKGAFEVARILDSVRKQPDSPVPGVQYVGQFGQKLRQVARLIKADVGVEVAFADMNGWDTHVNQSAQFPGLLREFGMSLAAFARDMGDRMADIVLVTMSEFGRTAAENGTGTDHGHGNVMMVLGGSVKGGTVYGTWPGLEPEQLFEGRDLAVMTDFRDVLGEIVATHLEQRVDLVFPGHALSQRLQFLRS